MVPASAPWIDSFRAHIFSIIILMAIRIHTFEIYACEKPTKFRQGCRANPFGANSVDIIYFLVQINDDDGSVQIRHSK